eukprot:m.64538 g.64538  ORF g.64538 m.64538 type:complete len:473 (-) comp13599_c0_seq1:181-1599(-)
MAVPAAKKSGTPSSTYTFASQPRAVPSSQRKKYRPEAPSELPSLGQTYGNMMHDPRIVRGSTLRSSTLPANQAPDPVELQKHRERQRRRAARKRAEERARADASPPPVEGRQHIEVQTELYLEELTDRVDEQDVETQTDAFLDRPPSPLFVPPKSGVDVATQIEAGELFDFDEEVQPILEVLVAKTLEQSLMEVMEEEELEMLRSHQQEYEELRSAELMEVQRLEENARRHEEEKQRRMRQQKEALAKEKETAEKIAARAFAQSYLSEIVPSVFGSLKDGGFFYDEQEREVETSFMPWLMDAVDERLEQQRQARAILDGIIREVAARRRETLGPVHPDPEPVAAPAPEAPEAEAPSAAEAEPAATAIETETETEAAPADADAAPTDADAAPADAEAAPAGAEAEGGKDSPHTAAEPQEPQEEGEAKQPSAEAAPAEEGNEAAAAPEPEAEAAEADAEPKAEPAGPEAAPEEA